MDNAQDFVIEGKVLTKYTGAGGDVVIPEGIKMIGDRAFAGCMSLQTVTFPEGVEQIAGGAFQNCPHLQTVTIPEGEMQIGIHAFVNTPWLKNLGEFAIVNHVLLKYQGNGVDVAIPEGVTRIGIYAFHGRKNLTRVTIPEGVKEICWGAFQDCIHLQTVTIPEGVQRIGIDAFSGCTNLTAVTIPKSITKIEERRFEGCPVFLLIAPHIPMKEFDLADRPSACCGFAAAYLEGQPIERKIRQGYLNYIKNHKRKMYSHSIKYEQLLQLMILEQMINRKDADLLLKKCDKQQTITAKAALLDYIGKNLEPVDPLKEFKL